MTTRLGPSVFFGAARSLRVVARLQQGAVLDEQWPQTLDGLLAMSARRRRLGSNYGLVADHHRHCDYLGLTRCRRLGLGSQWSWMASGARPRGSTDRELHWWHSRFDHAPAERAVNGLPPIVRTNQGRYRSYRTPLVVTVTSVLEWRAAGDAERVRDLLADVICVGKKRSQGEGLVLEWTVTDVGPPSDEWALWDVAGYISRPISIRGAPLLAPAADTVMAALRPPYFQGRQLRPAIAPWTRRPEREVIAMSDTSSGGTAP